MGSGTIKILLPLGQSITINNKTMAIIVSIVTAVFGVLLTLLYTLKDFENEISLPMTLAALIIGLIGVITIKYYDNKKDDDDKDENGRTKFDNF